MAFPIYTHLYRLRMRIRSESTSPLLLSYVVELTGQSFFRYCLVHRPRSGTDSERSPPPPIPASPELKAEPRSKDEPEIVIMKYSSRNFFSSINFLKILQKMTKHRSHRTFLLSQYKSSVSGLQEQVGKRCADLRLGGCSKY
jgi:hypothetical protein